MRHQIHTLFGQEPTVSLAPRWRLRFSRKSPSDRPSLIKQVVSRFLREKDAPPGFVIFFWHPSWVEGSSIPRHLPAQKRPAPISRVDKETTRVLVVVFVSQAESYHSELNEPCNSVPSAAKDVRQRDCELLFHQVSMRIWNCQRVTWSVFTSHGKITTLFLYSDLGDRCRMAPSAGTHVSEELGDLVALVTPAARPPRLPLYRREDISARQGVELSRATLCGWMASCAERLRPLYNLMIKRGAAAGYRPVA